MNGPPSALQTVDEVLEALDAVIARSLQNGTRVGYFAAIYRKVTANALDLCPPHAEEFHATVRTMIGWSSERTRTGAGRRSRRATPSAPKAVPGPTSDRERLRAIREWARENGYPELGNRGRIPQHIVAEYEAAHGG